MLVNFWGEEARGCDAVGIIFLFISTPIAYCCRCHWPPTQKQDREVLTPGNFSEQHSLCRMSSKTFKWHPSPETGTFCQCTHSSNAGLSPRILKEEDEGRRPKGFQLLRLCNRHSRIALHPTIPNFWRDQLDHTHTIRISDVLTEELWNPWKNSVSLVPRFTN